MREENKGSNTGCKREADERKKDANWPEGTRRVWRKGKSRKGPIEMWRRKKAAARERSDRESTLRIAGADAKP